MTMIAPTIKTHGRLAALGAYGVCAGVVALFALFVWVAMPSPTTGIDFEHSLITVASVAVICAALIAAHVAMARQIMGYLKEQGSAGEGGLRSSGAGAAR
jgi:hypothetical protein